MSMIINPYRFGGGGGGGGGGDPYFANVVLLMHCDGTNGSTTFTDSSSSGKTVTANGNAQLSTAQKKFGTASLRLPALGDYASLADSADWDFGSGDFTIEFFVRFDSVSGNRPLLAQRATGYCPWVISRSGTKLLVLLSFDNASWVAVPTLESATASIATATWYYVAITRSGSTFKLWLDGTEVDSYTSASSFVNSSNSMVIGSASFAAPAANLDEIRITKSVARDVSTVPTAAFPDS